VEYRTQADRYGDPLQDGAKYFTLDWTNYRLKQTGTLRTTMTIMILQIFTMTLIFYDDTEVTMTLKLR